MRTHWYRLISAGAAASCGAVLWTLSRLMSGAGVTPLMVAATIVAAGVGLSALALVLVSESVWSRIRGGGRSFVSWLRAIALRDNRRVGRALMVAGVVSYLVVTAWHLSTSGGPTDDDQSAFLQTASEVRNAGGPLGLIRDLYSGRFEEANRHPLYIGLLSLHPTWAFGRGLSLVMGGITLLLLTWLLRRTRGDLVAGLFCLLLGTNGAFCLFSTRVVCEVLMVLWAGLAYLMIAAPPTSRVIRPLLLGAVLGLAYLTKGTGLLLWLGYVLWVLLVVAAVYRTHDPSAPGESARHANDARFVLLAWMLLISPLVARNVQRYESMFYNVNSQLLFVDEYVDPVALAGQRSTGEALRDYVRTHSVGDMAERAISGLVWESFILLRILGPAPLDDSRILFGLPLMLCAVVAVIADPRREHALLAMWLLVCVPMFAWYIPVAAGDRFPLPLLAPLLMLAAEGIVRLMSSRLAEPAVQAQLNQH
jgi:hypothetical protein